VPLHKYVWSDEILQGGKIEGIKSPFSRRNILPGIIEYAGSIKVSSSHFLLMLMLSS